MMCSSKPKTTGEKAEEYEDKGQTGIRSYI